MRSEFFLGWFEVFDEIVWVNQLVLLDVKFREIDVSSLRWILEPYLMGRKYEWFNFSNTTWYFTRFFTWHCMKLVANWNFDCSACYRYRGVINFRAFRASHANVWVSDDDIEMPDPVLNSCSMANAMTIVLPLPNWPPKMQQKCPNHLKKK